MRDADRRDVRLRTGSLTALSRSDPTRSGAFDLLVAVAERRRWLEDALDGLTPAEPRDRAASHRIAASVLRRQGTLDAVLEPFLARSPPERVRTILRIGAASLLFLATPAHAAVATAVELARSRRLEAFVGLVNAVLRRVAHDPEALLAKLDGPRLDTPAWLWNAWGDRARAIAIAHQNEAPLDLTLRTGASRPPGCLALPGGGARLPSGTRVAELPGFDEGDFWVQDVAASLPARLLGARPGERVCDLCAAPGGKTAQLAAAGAKVTAVDHDADRLRLLRDNMRRLRLDPEIVQADALTWRPDQPFDAVLLDAPCSATGTARRHPEILRLRRQADIAALARRQLALLEAARAMLRPGGRLIYAVCSMQPEEGPAITSGWPSAPISPDELPGFEECITPEGTLRTDPARWPDRGGMDGFFAARLLSE